MSGAVPPGGRKARRLQRTARQRQRGPRELAAAVSFAAVEIEIV